MSAAKIIEPLKEAIDGNLARITIDGQVWTRTDLANEQKGYDAMRATLIKIARCGITGAADAPLTAETSRKMAREVLARFGESWPGREMRHDNY